MVSSLVSLVDQVDSQGWPRIGIPTLFGHANKVSDTGNGKCKLDSLDTRIFDMNEGRKKGRIGTIFLLSGYLLDLSKLKLLNNDSFVSDSRFNLNITTVDSQRCEILV